MHTHLYICLTSKPLQMRNIYLFFVLLLFTGINAQQQQVTYSISPPIFEENQSISITFDGSTINEATWGVTNNALYLWAWSFDLNDTNSMDSPTNGTWTNSNEANRLTYNAGNDTYSISFVPTEFFNRTGIGSIGFLIKAKNGDGDKKSQDMHAEVGLFQLTLTQPLSLQNIEINPGESVQVVANTSVGASFDLFLNGNLIYETSSFSTTFNHNFVPTESGNVVLQATDTSGTILEDGFNISIIPTVISQEIPVWIEPGINYHPSDASKAGLAIIAPGKNYIHVIGSFNNFQIHDDYVMKRDVENPELFWIELSNLNATELYTFQYRTNDNIRVADPYSPIVLSPYDDSWIESSTYPNLPEFPAGQDFEMSMFQIEQTSYSWNIENFEKPAQENLMVYEVLIRDFTEEKNFQSLIDKMDYFVGLNINAIELMPIMEFDGNQSWGYNPSFHYALDKAYGTQDKFKEFVDVAHQNGIAVILDIALNHATGRNPLVRLWNENTDGSGYGPVRSDNPYFNTEVRHTYGVFDDFNHQSEYTQYYVKRVIQHWINEYKIDGFRWDLTKGFTQNCTGSDESCTNSYQQDRVDVLKMYADYQWEVDPNSYVIFEHLGTAAEEAQWANYRIDEGKGIMTWNNLNHAFGQNTMGFENGSNLSRIDHENQGFVERRSLSYGESHDEERLMFKNLQYGASSGSYNVRNLQTSLDRLKAFGAVFFTVPGPKMIWQFGELGYDFGINRCEDGSYNNDCRLSPKPIPFEIGYDIDANRRAVYDTWSEFMNLRLANEVFNTNTYTVESGNLVPKIYVWNNDLPSSELNYVIVVANFRTNATVVTPNFPNTGTWYNLMDETSLQVTSTNQNLTLQAGDFKIFGNQPAERLNVEEVVLESDFDFKVLNNPVQNSVIDIKYQTHSAGKFSLYDLQGKLIQTHDVQSGNGFIQLKTQAKNGLYILVFDNQNHRKSEKILIP